MVADDGYDLGIDSRLVADMLQQLQNKVYTKYRRFKDAFIRSVCCCGGHEADRCGYTGWTAIVRV